MELTPGTRLGPYEIADRLGGGGMGEVFSARDTRLERRVAVKVLPSQFADDAQLRLRFEREAKTISQLTHPNICTLYDVGHENGRDYLVMELLEGESLADRLTRGPLPLEEVLTYGIQIAEALDKAHRAGVVHRDLKPGNVMLTRSGAKLLDFGLAKSGTAGIFAPQQSMLPTQAKPLTEQGTIVGTFQYMAPEQLDGAEADARTDIFALGAVLYEMATGRRAFEGKTRSSLIAAIVSAEPPPLSQIQPLTPPALEHVVRRCLRKDPAERWQSARDVAEELRWISAKGSQAGLAAPVAQRRKSRERLAWSIAAVALLAAATLGFIAWRRPRPVRIYSSLNAPAGKQFAFESSIASISPDGKAVAFCAVGSEGKLALWIRRLDSPEAQMITGSDGASFPFWSPDSRHVAFFADAKLKRVEVGGGPIDRLAEPAVAARGGAWSNNDVIVFAPSTSDALYRVSAAGGDVVAVTKLDTAANETSHRFPTFLPDGKHFLYFVQGVSSDQKNIYVSSIDGGAPKKLLAADGQASYAEPGYLLWVRDRILRGRKFDAKKLEFQGDPFTLSENIQSSTNMGFSNFSVAANGALTYVAGESGAVSRIVLMGQDGKEISAVPAASEYYDPRLSPDGRKLVFVTTTRGISNLFLYDIVRRVTTRFTFGKTGEWGPVWSPDGTQIAFTSFEGSPGDLHVKSASGTTPEQKLIGDSRRKVLSDWSDDGRFLFYHVNTPKMAWDIEVYSFAERKVRPFLQTPFAEAQARLSPNGRWVAYASNEAGRSEVYVREFSAAGGGDKIQISSAGGQMPSWAPDGKKIYYVAPDGKLMAVNVNDVKGFDVDLPQVALDVRLRGFVGLTRPQYDISRDRKTFVANIVSSDGEAPASVTLVQNWLARR